MTQRQGYASVAPQKVVLQVSCKIRFFRYISFPHIMCMSIFLEINAYVSANLFYGANSARICDSTTNSCKCSTTTEQCTGETICNTDGTCQGKYTKSYKH